MKHLHLICSRLILMLQINTFIQQGCIKLTKSDSNNKMTKNVSMSTQKIWSSTTIFNIGNNHKCFLSSKSAY